MREESVADLTFGELSRANRRRTAEAFQVPVEDWSPSDWAAALAGEVGEACNLITKRRRGTPVPVDEIADELADAIVYADLLCQRLGIDLGEAVRQKFNSVSRRIGSAIEL